MLPVNPRRHDEQPALQQADEQVGDQAEDGVDRQADEHDVGAVGGLGLDDQVADAALRVDLLRHDDDQPAADQRETQADEEARQRPGRITRRTRPQRVSPNVCAGLHQLHVDAADRRVGVDVHGERACPAR